METTSQNILFSGIRPTSQSYSKYVIFAARFFCVCISEEKPIQDAWQSVLAVVHISSLYVVSIFIFHIWQVLLLLMLLLGLENNYKISTPFEGF